MTRAGILALALALVLAAGPALAATCRGKDPCRACKTCRYCRRCSKEGGSCGVCAKRKPEPKPAPRKGGKA